MSAETFCAGLIAEGLNPVVEGGFVVFDYAVPVGPLIGCTVRVAFQEPSGFPAACPTGPCVSPRILPLNTSTPHAPLGGVHASPTPSPQEEWEYWSRPYPNWTASLGVSDYMAHVRRLFDEVPDDAIQCRPQH